MYDNIIIKASLLSIGREDFFVEAQSFPNSIIEDKDGEATKVIFYCRNLKVIVTTEKVVIRGSICKYHLRTNQYTLTLQTTEEAFKELSEELQLPLNLFNVMYFEFESNLIMDHDVQYYYAFLGDCKGFKSKCRVQSSVYYKNNYRRLVFYDKIKQINNSKSEQVKVIKEFKNRNILRFGVRYQKTVCKKFNRASLTVADLYSKDFYNEVVTKWKEEYFNIFKYKQLTFKDIVFKDFRTFIVQFSLIAMINAGGLDYVLGLVEQAYLRGVFKHDSQKYRIRKALKDLFSQASMLTEDIGIVELDRKINEEATRHMR